MTVSLNKAQKDAIKLIKRDVVATIGTSTAHALITKGLAERASVDPVPTMGIALQLTQRGHSWKG